MICGAYIAQVLVALKGPMPACGQLGPSETSANWPLSGVKSDISWPRTAQPTLLASLRLDVRLANAAAVFVVLLAQIPAEFLAA